MVEEYRRLRAPVDDDAFDAVNLQPQQWRATGRRRIGELGIQRPGDSAANGCAGASRVSISSVTFCPTRTSGRQPRRTLSTLHTMITPRVIASGGKLLIAGASATGSTLLMRGSLSPARSTRKLQLVQTNRQGRWQVGQGEVKGGIVDAIAQRDLLLDAEAVATQHDDPGGARQMMTP